MEVLKHGRAHRWQTCLTQTCKNLHPNMTGASILPLTTLRSSLSIYIFLAYNNIIFFLFLVNGSPEVTFGIAFIYTVYRLL
jgi:hypothetical protein